MIFLVILNIFLCTNFDHFLSRYGHSIVPGELIVRSSNLKPERYKDIPQKMLNLVPRDDFCDPDEVFEVFF